MKEIKGKVVSYCEIPEELTENHWLNDYSPGCYVMAHIDESEDDLVSKWLLENYPDLKDEEYFFVEIDY